MTETQAAAAGPFPVPGLTPPTQRTGAKRRIGDVIVMLGFAERKLVESVVDKGHADGMPARPVADRSGHRRLQPARTRARRAQRPRLRRPQLLRGGQGRRQPDRCREGTPLPDDPDRVRRRGHPARRDRRSGQRARSRRHHDGDRVRGAPRGRLARGHRGADQPDVPARGVGPRDRRGGGHHHRRGDRASRSGRRGPGRQARPHDHRRCGQARGIRHPLRTAGGRHARALSRRRRRLRHHHRDAQPRRRTGLASEDHVRSRHRREASSAGRPDRAHRRRPLRGPARGDPARRSRRVGRDANSRQGEGRDGPRRARDGRARSRALRDG